MFTLMFVIIDQCVQERRWYSSSESSSHMFTCICTHFRLIYNIRGLAVKALVSHFRVSDSNSCPKKIRLCLDRNSLTGGQGWQGLLGIPNRNSALFHQLASC